MRDVKTKLLKKGWPFILGLDVVVKSGYNTRTHQRQRSRVQVSKAEGKKIMKTTAIKLSSNQGQEHIYFLEKLL